MGLFSGAALLGRSEKAGSILVLFFLAKGGGVKGVRGGWVGGTVADGGGT